MLRDEALVVHLFAGVAEDAPLMRAWELCGTALGMTEPMPGPGGAADATHGLLAARSRPGPGRFQAALRRERDVTCLSALLEGPWSDMDRRWTEALGEGGLGEGGGLLGAARLYLARLDDPAAPPDPRGPLAASVRAHAPAGSHASARWWDAGVVVTEGFAVWELSETADVRVERRLAVVAAHDRDPQLTAWAWTTRSRELPPLGRYLLHAARLRYQLRVWSAAPDIAGLRAETDTVIAALLDRTAADRPADLVAAAHVLVDLQAREQGLIDRSTRSREMARTVEIAAANLAALGGEPAPGGPVADDLALADWFRQRLDDEATYLETASRRAERVGALADQLVERGLRHRQQVINLGLTGAVGAILMSLAAVQSLEYAVPLPGPVKPAVITGLGAAALLASFVVLRVVAPERAWSLLLVRCAVAAIGAAIAWIVVAAVAGDALPAWAFAVAGGLVAVLVQSRWRRS